MITITDARNKKIVFSEPPKRVVSLIPSITEALFDLGAGEAIAGVSNYCIHPAEGVKNKIKVGGQKNPDMGKIKAIHPDLIILNMEENKPEHIKFLSQHYTTWVTYPRLFRDAENLLMQLGKVFDAESRASVYADKIRISSKQLSSIRRRKIKTMYLIWRNPWMSINRDTFIHNVLELHHMENVYAKRDKRYFEVTAQDIEDADPDIIILPDEPYHFREKHKSEFSHLSVSAVKNSRIFLADGTYFCWYGTRTARASQYIHKHILSRLDT